MHAMNASAPSSACIFAKAAVVGAKNVTGGARIWLMYPYWSSEDTSAVKSADTPGSVGRKAESDVQICSAIEEPQL